MAFPVNSNTTNPNVFSRYIQWLLDQINNRQLGGGPATAYPDVNRAYPDVAALGAGGLYGGDIGAALRNAQRTAPGSFAGTNIYAGLAAQPNPETLMQEPSSLSSDQALNMLRGALNVGNYQFADMSKDFINQLANAWDKYNNMTDSEGMPISFKASYDSISPKYNIVMTDTGLAPIDVNDPKSTRMAGLFNLIRGGATADGLLGNEDVQKMGLSDQEIDDLKSFSNEEKVRKTAAAQMDAGLANLAQDFGLPSPTQQWEIPPEVAGAIWQRQKTGLTDVQAAQQEADVLRSRFEGSQGGYVPKTRDQIRAELMKKYAAEDAATAQVIDNPIVAAQQQDKIMAAAKKVSKGGGTADSAERAAMAKMTELPVSFATKGRQKGLDAKRAAEIDAMVEAMVRGEGYKAMRGLPGRGDDALREEAWRAQMRLTDAQQRERDLAAKIQADLTANVGTPTIDALARALAIKSYYSKDYSNPSNLLNSYPFNSRIR